MAQTISPSTRRTKPSRKRHFPCVTISFLFLLTVICLAAVAAIGTLIFLPAQVDRAFGPPAPGIGLFQRTYLSARLFLHSNDLTLPHNPFAGGQPFKIEMGESPLSVASRLKNEGFISDAGAFRDFLVYSGQDKTIQAGDYTLSAKMSAIEIAKALQDATPTEVNFRILPGWRIEEIAEALPTSGLNIPAEVFVNAASTPPPGNSLSKELPPHATLEGFLFPGAYTLPRDTNTIQLINTLLNNFEGKVGNDIRGGFTRQGLSLFEGVTLASMVEREAVVGDEMPMIASVFLNRLAAGEMLASDPTVQYAIGYNPEQKTWWTNPLSASDLQIDSPFNTYRVTGLPPGPIASPGLHALQAVAFPAKTNYYYFRAACDNSGRHTFSETYNQHVQSACP